MQEVAIPNIPLTMPDTQNLYRQPKQPYPYATQGVIRGKDFNDLLEIIFSTQQDPNQFKEQINERFDYHVISDMFPERDYQEMNDFCRHVLVINKNNIGWDLVDDTMRKLANMTIPGWRLPNFDFVEEFHNVLNLVKKLYFPDRLRNQITMILEETKIEEVQFDEEVKKHLHLWSIRDLWLLLSYLTKKRKRSSVSDAIKQMINLISNKFEETIDSDVSLKAKICLILLYIDALDGYNKQVTMRSKELIDRIWIDIKDLEYTDKISFKYLLGAAYSMVGYHLFKQDTDFVTRKLFIDNFFVQNYITEDYDLGRWFADLLDYEMDELIFDLLIRGYSKTVPLLHQHGIELPASETKDDIMNRISQFNEILSEIIIYYLSIPDTITDIRLKEVRRGFVNNLKFDKTRMNALELLQQVTTSAVFYNPEFTDVKFNKLYETTYSFLNEFIDPVRAMAFEIDYLVNRDEYDFDRLFEAMKENVEQNQSLLFSDIFENEIIQRITIIIDYAETISTRQDIYLEIYEISLQFLLEWLTVFSQDQSMFNEVLLMFSPLINICFFQQIRWYYENNFGKKAFLTNLNLHAFMNYYSHRLDRFDNLQFHKIQLGDHKDLSQKYKEITERWKVRDLLQQDEIKEMIIDTRDKFKKSGLKQKKPTGSLIEDALIHGYLEEINRLEDFISKDFSQHPSGKLEEFLYDSKIYLPGINESKYRLQRVAYDRYYGEIIPVPLFNNIHQLNIATEFFEIRANVDQIEERNKQIQEKYEARV